MSPAQAIRFAKTVLSGNDSEEEFEVEVFPADQESVAEAFRSLGCTVTYVDHKPWLRIAKFGKR